ncbi:MAG: response regulator [Planctomycetes bacterium]|nr:response regulator [Planctomycetota bacterium]
MGTPLAVLLVEDRAEEAALVLAELRRAGFRVTSERVMTPDLLKNALASKAWDIALTDYTMPNFSGLEAIAIIRAASFDLPIIMISSSAGEDVAVEAMKAGASDFFSKGNLVRIGHAVRRALAEAVERRARKKAEEDLRKTAEQFRQAQKMEAIGRLAGGVAHDFNNLLQLILGCSNLLLDRLPPEDPSRADIEEIRLAGERASSLTRQLLAFSRKQIAAPVVLDLNDAVRNCEKMLRRLIGEDIHLSLSLAEGLRAIEADPALLDQVLMNLAVNARDAMPEGGSLEIRTANARLGESEGGHLGLEPGEYVSLAVADTGCGMTNDVKSHLFEPFFTTKGPGKGTGLGLSTVHGIVKQARSAIEVESAVGKGSMFRIFFPAIDRTAVAPVATPAKPASRGGGETILVVEDEDQVRTLIRRMLQKRGYRVLEAPNGLEALRLARRETAPIDLVLSDTVMPEMGGIELARELATVRPGVSVMLVSGYSQVEIGAAHFIQKPFSAEDLARKVREIIDGSKKP